MLSFEVVGHGETTEGFFVLVLGKVSAADVVGKTVQLDGVAARVRAVVDYPVAWTALYLDPSEDR